MPQKNISPSFIIAPRRLRIPDAAKYIAGSNWFVEEKLREGEIPFQWCGRHGRKMDGRELCAGCRRNAAD